MNPNESTSELLARHAAEDAAGKLALKDPLPGAAAEAFAGSEFIKVGEYNVRRFVDGDFRILRAAKHPFAGLQIERLSQLQSEDFEKQVQQAVEDISPLGQNGWMLYWLLTRPAKGARAELKAKGIEAVLSAAEDEFADKQLAELVDLLLACVRQFTGFWSTAIPYGSAEAAKAGEAANAPVNPTPSSDQPLTG